MVWGVTEAPVTAAERAMCGVVGAVCSWGTLLLVLGPIPPSLVLPAHSQALYYHLVAFCDASHLRASLSLLSLQS
ncbi:hypothetical protein BDQ12DRAFT_692924 [Crucibulum laeve]|uniref:Uncharacterized protein n=1 Tax=Crucibulum laeve TaxID=68775 RepID=A0A5C3LTQ0_9AGAR|nr:hypothetical protein BDQ12DRAFT_692924 [Crucibulum laeve]